MTPPRERSLADRDRDTQVIPDCSIPASASATS